MRVLVAGATGAIGRPVVRALLARGHEVVGLTRQASRCAGLEAAGARPVVADAMDEAALARAFRETRPSDVALLLTRLPPEGALRAAQLRPTNVVRIEGTARVLRAAAAAGCRRVVAQSFVSVYGDPEPSSLLEEDTPLPPVPAGPLRESVAALRSLEGQLAGARRERRVQTVALRIGALHGPEVPSTRDLFRRLRTRRMAVPRRARGVLSFVHVDDAAAAVVSALEAASPAPVYNVADDEPMALGRYVDRAAELFGAPEPSRVPKLLVRLAAPVPAAVAELWLAMSNERAKRELGWRPTYPTPREGLRHAAEVLGGGA